MKSADVRTQVAVLGGGPAGTTVATLLAQRGIDVKLFDRERFPRFHIGESLMTETWWTFERLGVLDRLKASDFPRKYSVQFISERGNASRPFYFFETNSHESSGTWQVDRAEFDAMLLENARDKGVDVRTGAEAKRVLFEGTRAVGVEVTFADGETTTVRADVVADATGLHALLGRQLKLLRPDPSLRKAALFAHFEGAYRDSGKDEGATIILHTRGNRGWFWNIPLSRDRVSLGVVGSVGELIKGRGRPQEILDEEISNCPTVKERLKDSRQISAAHVVNDFSYRATRVAGDGWVLLGDAFGFIDPVYSTGVFLALKSGEMAADAIVTALEKENVCGSELGSFGGELARAMEALRKLVCAFYTPGFSFADFVAEHPEHRNRLVDLLTGNVFKEGITDIFRDMKGLCDLPDERPLLATND